MGKGTLSSLRPYLKIVTKGVINPNIKAVTIKLVEENAETFRVLCGGRFLRMQKALIIKILVFIKIKD